MAGRFNPIETKSLNKLKRLADRRMAEAHEAVANARRLADQTDAIRAETRRLHVEMHSVPVPGSEGVPD